MSEPKEYPWQNAYPQAFVEIPLIQYRVEPVAVLSGLARQLPAPIGGAGGEILLDFAEEYVGYLTLQVECPAATEIRICYGEFKDEALQRYSSPLDWYRDPEDHFVLKPGCHMLRSKGRRAFRYVRLIASAPATVTSVVMEAGHYPVLERGRFRCSDEILNRIWEISCRTTRLCMQRFYEDGIKRDGMLWIGDYRVQYLCNAMAFGDVALARKSLFMFAASQREDGALLACATRGGGHQHPDRIEYMPYIPERLMDMTLFSYCTDYVSAVYEFWMHTGEIETVRQLWPCLQRLLRYLRESDTLTVEPFLTDNCQFTPLASRTGMRMGFCEAMLNGARLARAVGDAATEQAAQERYAAESTCVRRDAWDTRRQVFADGDLVCWHANVQSVLAGVTSAGSPARELLERLLNMPEARRPIGGMPRFYALRALFDAGLDQAALDWIRRDWGQVVDAGLTTCPEGIPEDFACLFHHEPEAGKGKPNDQFMWSMCHGWSAGPAYLLSAYVLGVRPAAPGFASHTDEPRLGNLAWAEGVVPTPRGDLRVSLHKD
jgi:alpha-L-rhamnosidase